MADLLKNLYNKEYIEVLADNLVLSYSKLNKEKFIKSIFDDKWSEKELKERMRHISSIIYDFLPSSYEDSIDILKNTFLKISYDFGLQNMIFQDFVEVYGIEDFDKSMEALECFTKNSSSEFAIRRFILKYPVKTMKIMKNWAKSDDFHVRGLASEGCRPRLPWTIALPEFKKNPEKVIEILEILKNDESKYVQKSIANNLNDISKDKPELVINIAKNWLKDKNKNWIVKHGCRTLFKSGNQEALELFGFAKPENIKLINFILLKEPKIGEELEFSFELESKNKLGKLRIEYAIYFLRQKNKYSKKVFKISEGIFNNKIKKISKKYSLKKITTRKYYEGEHKISIIINGIEIIKKEFLLNGENHAR